MARFNTNGLDDLILDLDKLGDIPDDTIDRMLMAGGEVIAKAHREQLQSEGLVGEETLKNSIAIYKKMTNLHHGIGSGDFKAEPDTRYVLVYPKGVHHTFASRERTYTKKNWGREGETMVTGGGIKEATNQDVGFVHEFGGHGNEPTQWMREANEKHAGEAVEAEFAVFDNWNKSHNL